MTSLDLVKEYQFLFKIPEINEALAIDIIIDVVSKSKMLGACDRDVPGRFPT